MSVKNSPFAVDRFIFSECRGNRSFKHPFLETADLLRAMAGIAHYQNREDDRDRLRAEARELEALARSDSHMPPNSWSLGTTVLCAMSNYSDIDAKHATHLLHYAWKHTTLVDLVSLMIEEETAGE